MSPDEERLYKRRRDARSIALGVTLAALAILFYAITVARMVE